jgi:hypothetical protein
METETIGSKQAAASQTTSAQDVKEAGRKGLQHTGRFIHWVLDKCDIVDRWMYGWRMKAFIMLSVATVLIAPIIDHFLKADPVTLWLTRLFVLFLLVSFLSWISGWRDDEGNWTWGRARSRLGVYWRSTRDFVVSFYRKSPDHKLFALGASGVIGGICFKAINNVSVFIRLPMEGWLDRPIRILRKIEGFTNPGYYIMLAGTAILAYAYYKHPELFKWQTLRQLLGFKSQNHAQKISVSHMHPVVDLKGGSSQALIARAGSSPFFNEFVQALHEWKPKQFYYEYKYQDNLYEHLRKRFPEASIELEKPIGSRAQGTAGRADVVINDTILIEMKKGTGAAVFDRAKGQVYKYSQAWGAKGPVVLLLCDTEYDKAHPVFAPFISDQQKLNRDMVAVVV